MGKLTELMKMSLGDQVPGPDTNSMLAEWGHIPFAQLSVVLVHLRHLALVHQTNHWIARGDSYYGDHLLFERLYSGTEEDIDGVAERAVGMGNEQNVDLLRQTSQLAALVSASSAGQALPQETELAQRSLDAEQAFLKVIDAMSASMKQDGSESSGIENLLQGISDKHEGHVYLLKRRCAGA